MYSLKTTYLDTQTFEDIMQEIWIQTNVKVSNGNNIIEVSNRGRIKRANGDIEESTLRQTLNANGKRTRIHRFIAEHFIPKTQEDIALGRDCIDHITHNPIGMNVNDVRNLRWCTIKENNNFDEGRKNRTISNFGKKYVEHFGYGCAEYPKQYYTEWMYYHRNGKFRWE